MSKDGRSRLPRISTMSAMQKNGAGLPPVGDRIITGLSQLKKALDKGAPLHKHFTIRTVELDLEPAEYAPNEIRGLRATLGVSQAIFAEILGVTVHAVRAWEQGKRTPTKTVRRLMEEISRNPARWIGRLQDAARRRKIAG